LQGQISSEKIEEIRERVDIAHLISEHVVLKKAGRNFVGHCPFHKEKTPSFSVSPDKGMFYCFGCGAGGNVFSFLMQINGMTFPEAARYLAERAGISLPDAYDSLDRTATEKERLYRVNKQAAQWFAGNFTSRSSLSVKNYLADRDITADLIQTFALGYAPDSWTAFRSYCEGENIAPEDAERAGLIIKGKEGGYYDRFRDRLMIPISDADGRVIAFGGRTVAQEDPKYLNSPETPLYIKGRHLYGLNKTKEFIRREGHAILVEGYFDLLALWSAGFRAVVASLGTALTKEHVRLLRRYAQKVFIAFDADEAGKKAAARSFGNFLDADMDVRVISLPEGCDPDDCIRRYGRDVFAEAIQLAEPVETYFLEKILPWDDTVIGKKKALHGAIDFSLSISDPLARDLFLQKVSARFGVDHAILKRELRRKETGLLPGDSSPTVQREVDIPEQEVNKAELTLAYLLLENPRHVETLLAMEGLDYFEETPLKNLVLKIIRDVGEDGRGKVNTDDLIQGIENGRVQRNLLAMIMDGSSLADDVARRMLADTVEHLKKQWFKKQHQHMREKLIRAQQIGDDEMCMRLIRETEKLIRRERGNTVPAP
jgi:DNA primase